MLMGRKPVITYLLWDTDISGGNRNIFEHINGLIDRGFRVHCLAHFGGQPNWFPLNTEVLLIPPFSERIPDTDLVIATYWPTAYEVANLKADIRLYFVQGFEPIFSNDSVVHEVAKNTYRLNLKFLCLSKWLQELLERRFGVTSFHVPSGINNSLFRVLHPREFKEEGDTQNILTVLAHFAEWKGIHDLMEAARIVKQRRGNIKFTLISTHEEGPPAIFDTYISNPSQAELVRQYNLADIFLYPAWVEGFGMPPLEAMACGAPVVLTNSGGVLDFARHNFNSILIPPKNPEIMATEVMKLADDRELRIELSKNALATVTDFDWEKIIDRLADFYEELYHAS
ncbi:MAG: glycosyltransferase family 4 protein [Pseudomonadota bacterium]